MPLWKKKTSDFLSFPDYFKQKQDINLLTCYTRLRQFRQLEKQAQRKNSSQNIWDKYLGENAEKKFDWPNEKKRRRS